MMDPQLLRSSKVSLVLAASFFGNVVIGGIGYAIPYLAQTDAADIKDQILQGAASAAGQPMDVMRRAITFEGDLGYAFGFGLLAFAVHITIGTSATSMTAGPAAGAWGRTRGLRSPLIAATSIMTAMRVMLAMWHGSWPTVLILYAASASASASASGSSPRRATT